MKVKLDYMVCPDQLKEQAYVQNPVCVKIINPNSKHLEGILGESGKELAEAGLDFYFEKKIAEKLIEQGVAKKADIMSIIDDMIERVIESINAAETRDDLEIAQINALGRRGEIQKLLPLLREVDSRDRPRIGQAINRAKDSIVEEINKKSESV